MYTPFLRVQIQRSEAWEPFHQQATRTTRASLGSSFGVEHIMDMSSHQLKSFS
jgi:hypothetical protein